MCKVYINKKHLPVGWKDTLIYCILRFISTRGIIEKVEPQLVFAIWIVCYYDVSMYFPNLLLLLRITINYPSFFLCFILSNCELFIQGFICRAVKNKTSSWKIIWKHSENKEHDYNTVQYNIMKMWCRTKKYQQIKVTRTLSWHKWVQHHFQRNWSLYSIFYIFI